MDGEILLVGALVIGAGVLIYMYQQQSKGTTMQDFYHSFQARHSNMSTY